MSWKNKIVAPELLKERSNINFDQKELKSIYHTEPGIDAIRDHVVADMAADPLLCSNQECYELTRGEMQTLWMKKLNHLWFKKDRKFYFHEGKAGTFHWFYMHQGQIPIGMHATMFKTSIETFCDEEQLKKWLPLTQNLNILGCYAQTEMGHGSDVAGLDTTATFDIVKDEFIINTPSLKATKWWPGDMGRMANHAIVFARLIIEDEGTKNDFGVMPFIVQIRDMETHRWMPGIQCGEMGPKFGYNSKDNGWLSLNQVRIPRLNMPMKFTKVDRDGTFSIEADTRLIYSTMLKTRQQIASSGKWVLMYCLTIALRYSVVRR